LPTTCITNGRFQFHNLENKDHLQRVQHLKPEDRPRRIAFCQWLLQKIDEHNFLSILLTTDQIRERGFQLRFAINVWAGIIGMGNRLRAPHVLPQHLNGEEY
jgi:hypothetical protein